MSSEDVYQALMSREIVAMAQVHGGTRVIELSVHRFCGDFGIRDRARVAAYDSNHRDAAVILFTGSADFASEVEAVRVFACGALTRVVREDACDCWAGWDPYCGEPGCWGVYSG